MPPHAAGSISADMTARLAKAFSALDYDLFVLSPEDRETLAQAKVQTAPAWQTPDATPRVVTKKVPDGQLAFVLFPPAQPDGPTGAVATTLADTATKLRASGKYNLVIGVSTWGQPLENDFIASQGKAFDIILGSGEGPGYPGLYLQDNAVLWVRPSVKGKGVNTIVIPTLPKAGEKAVWSPNASVMASVQPLNESVASDQSVAAIFAP